MDFDSEAMLEAIKIARLGIGCVSPNPLVGAVIFDKNKNKIGEGYHQKVGDAHAEINAIKSVKNPESLVGATIYITLEPCSHHGRTPPCCEALARSPISEIVYGITDPNPKVSGKGAEYIQNSGKKIRRLSDESVKIKHELNELAEHFLWNQKFKQTFFSLKVASSLDGQLAAANGESQWITGPEARAHTHFLRASHDAVMIGAGTLLADNPRLDIRIDASSPFTHLTKNHNQVIVLSPTGRAFPFLKKSLLLSMRPPQKVLLCINESAWKIYKAESPEAGFEIEVIKDMDFEEQLPQRLYQRGIYSALLEAGPTIAGQWLKKKSFQRLYLFQAPLILGSGSNKAWSQNFVSPNLDLGLKLSYARVQQLGEDFLIEGSMDNENSK